jgi:hypothetical protein
MPPVSLCKPPFGRDKGPCRYGEWLWHKRTPTLGRTANSAESIQVDAVRRNGLEEVRQVEVDGLQCLAADHVAIGEVDVKVLPKVVPRQQMPFEQDVEASGPAKFADGRLDGSDTARSRLV